MEPIVDMLELQPMAGAGMVDMVDTLELQPMAGARMVDMVDTMELQTMAGAGMVDTPEPQPTVDVGKPEELQLKGRRDESQLHQYLSEDLRAICWITFRASAKHRHSDL